LKNGNSKDEIKIYDDNEEKEVKMTLSHSEELSLLIFSSLCKKTSVLFDIYSLCELLMKE
jgi:hypothetical protein